MRRFWLVLACVMLVVPGVAACGGGGNGGGNGGTPAPGGGLTPAAEVEVPESLQFLGDLAKVRSAPVTETFDASARSLPLADGAVLEVPAGAFAAPTGVTVVVADLAFDAYVDEAPDGTVYVVSTDEPVELATPVVLELPVPANSVRVVQSLDGDDWRAVEVPPGATTRVPIPHFSTTYTIVTGPREGALVLQGPPADGEAPGLFLRACILSIAEALEAAGGTTGDRMTQDSFDIAAWLCTNALVKKFSPTGDYVSVECVGDTMSRGADFRDAIADCAAQAAGTTTPDQPTPGSDGPTPGSDATAPDGIAIPDGTYRGPVDFKTFYEAVSPLVASHLKVRNNEIVAVVKDGRLDSLSGSAQVGWPSIFYDDGETCATNGTSTFAGDPTGAPITNGRFQVPMQVTWVGTSQCSTDKEPYSDDDTSNTVAVGQFDPASGSIQLSIELGDDEPGGELSAALKR